jgi:hypothetical protein
MAEAHRATAPHRLVPAGDALLHQVGAGDAQMDAAGGQLARDFPGGQQAQLHIRAVDLGGVVAVRPGAAHGQAARGEPVGGLVHQPALGRDAEAQRHGVPPARRSRTSSGGSRRPRPGSARPQDRGQRVVAPAGGHGRQVGAGRRQEAEDETVVVFHRGAPEAGLEGQAIAGSSPGIASASSRRRSVRQRVRPGMSTSCRAGGRRRPADWP